MPARGTELFEIPRWFWDLPQTTAALRARDIGKLFLLVQEHTKVSQTQIGTACDLTQPKISQIERGLQQVLHLAMFDRIASALEMPDAARMQLGLAPKAEPRKVMALMRAGSPGDAQPILESDRVPGLPSPVPGGGQEEGDPVRRRDFVGLAGASLFAAVLPATPRSAVVDAEPLAPVLMGNPASTITRTGAAPDLAALAAVVNQARCDYQSCHYSELMRYLPDLLGRLHTAQAALDGDERLSMHALSADAHHVAAGLLLKLDDHGLAYLAADRSMQAARASEDPLVIGASSRIITHVLMCGGHNGAAAATASSYASRLDHDISRHTPESLSVYGSILLRGAIAAAEDDNRHAAYELLAEADEAGRRLGVDGNLLGTAFGPVNARQHRVYIAGILGDAGTAVDVARSIDLGSIKVTERKASLLIDTARAYLQWGKHDKAYMALRAAEQTAHEEVAGRPAVHRLVRELVTSAPPTVKRDAEGFAAEIGVSR